MFHYLFSSVQDVTIGGRRHPEHRAALSHRPGDADNGSPNPRPEKCSRLRRRSRGGISAAGAAAGPERTGRRPGRGGGGGGGAAATNTHRQTLPTLSDTEIWE